MARDYYETLGVERGADDGQIKKAFRKLARELHPDVNAHDPDAEEKFKEAAGAYEVLSDPERRRLYDAYGEEGLRGRGYAPDMDAFGSVSDLFSAIFGQGGFEAAFGGPGGGGRRGRGGGTQGGDVVTSATIDLADSARGIQVEVAYQAAALCGTCHGNGAEPGTPIVACRNCDGTGQHQRVARTAFGQLVRTAICDVCGGDGRVPETPCHECDGAGLVREQRRVAVDIPPGIADNQRIRLTRRGHAGQNGGPAGDLYVVVRVREDERFLRDGEDLITVIDVPAPLAALGTTVEIPTFDGPVPIDVPAGTQPGEQILLRGRGLPPLSRGRTGDIRVVVNVATPRRLSRAAEGPARALRGDDHGRQHALRRGHAREAQAGARGVIRLAVRVPRAAAEIVLAELLELVPGGLEETDVSADIVEYALYGAAGELPDLPALQAAAGDTLVEVSTSEVPDDWADRWKAWHRPVDVAWRFRRLRVRPPWEEALAGEEGIDLVIDPGQAFGTGAHHTTRLCLELLLELDPEGALADWGSGSGVLAIAAARLGYSPVLAVDVEPASLEASAENARVNAAEVEVRRVNLRREPAPWAPTVTANLVRPLLLDVARLLEQVPERLIASGLLREEADEVAAAFARTGCRSATAAAGASGPPCCSPASA